MSQSAQTTNGAASPAGGSQSHYTLVSHINTKASLSPTRTLTPGTAARKDTAMDDATSTSSPLSSVPSSPVTSAKSNESRLPLETRLATLEQIMSKADDDEVAVASKDISPSARSVTAPETGEDPAAKQPNKRTREEHATQDDTQPKLKKPATEVNVKAAQSAPAEAEALHEATGANDDGIDGASSSDELAESKKPARKPKPKSKAAPKKRAATSRRGPPACATCKKRKVKCTHNSVEESPAGEGNPAIHPTSDNTADKEENPKKSMDTNEIQAVLQVDSAHNDDEPSEDKPSNKSKAKKKPAPKSTRAPPERTSTRNRKAPERFEDLQEQPAPRTSPPRKGTSRVFDPIYITTNSTSRLGKADIYHMLLKDEAWTSLSAEQQATLVSMFPDSAENQRLLARIKAGETNDTRPQWLKASDVFRDEVAKFKDDLTNGHLAKTWQTAAEQAVVERAAGEYDAWKAEEAELWWGQKSK